MDRKIRKQIVKRTVGHYERLIEHSQRDYEPSPDHLRKRLLQPLCEDFNEILECGTTNDFRDIVEGIADQCKDIPERNHRSE